MTKTTIPITLAFVAVLAMSAYVPLGNADVEKPVLFVEKNISQSKFSWTDTEMITIKVINEGSSVAKKVHVIDHIPAGFVATKENSTINDDALSVDLSDLKTGEEQTITYSLTGKSGMNGNVQISLQPAEATYNDTQGSQYEKKSNHVEIVIESSNWQQNLAGTTLFLVVLTFGFGYFGSIIHWTSSDSKTKDEDKNKTAWKQAFLGGAAGIIVLGTFQGLSTLFSGGQLQLTTQNIVVLAGTCLASGFAPNAVIDKATQQWKDKADQANKDKAKLNEENQAKKAETKDTHVTVDRLQMDNTELSKKVLQLSEEKQHLQQENENLKQK